MKKRIWKDYEPSTPSVVIDNKEYTGKVHMARSVYNLNCFGNRQVYVNISQDAASLSTSHQ